MDTKLISSGNLPLLHNSDKLQAVFSTSHIAFSSNITTTIKLRRKFLIKTSSRSFRSISRATVKSFYMQPETTSETFYDLLGISASGTLSDIKKAYKQLARTYHPDVSPPGCMEKYTKMFIAVHEAYATLYDPQSRALYDLDLARGLHLSFSSKNRSASDESSEVEWKCRWQSQLNELKRRTVNKDTTDTAAKASWGARMRRQR